MAARTGKLWVWLLGLAWLCGLGAGGYYLLAVARAQPAQGSYYTDAQAREGEIAYAQACASCHGPDLDGVSAPALRGEAFREGWEGRTVADLYRYTQSRMPQGRGGSLSTNVYVTSTAYVLQQNGFPAGEEPLEPGAARLAELPLRRAGAADRAGQGTPGDGAGDPADASASRSGEAAGARALQNGEPPPIEARTPPTEAGGPGSGDPVAQAQAQVGDLRVSVLPDAAEVVVTGPSGYRRAFTGGSTMLSGLEPGSYTVAANFQGERIERTGAVAGGEVAGLALSFSAATAPTPNTATDAPNTAADTTGNVSEDTIAGVTLDGGQLYNRHCAACHGSQGGGGFGPALSSNPRLSADEWVIRRVAGGGLGMPAYGKEFAPPELAAVTNYIRTHFGNAYGEVTPEQVRRVEAGIPAAQLSRAVPNLAAASLGQQRYVQLCSACHGLQGGGAVGPPLAGNTNLDNDQLVLTTLLYGRGIMPPYSLHSDREIAEITSYIRNEWSNAYSPVGTEQVRAYRPDAGEGTQP